MLLKHLQILLLIVIKHLLYVMSLLSLRIIKRALFGQGSLDLCALSFLLVHNLFKGSNTVVCDLKLIDDPCFLLEFKQSVGHNWVESRRSSSHMSIKNVFLRVTIKLTLVTQMHCMASIAPEVKQYFDLKLPKIFSMQSKSSRLSERKEIVSIQECKYLENFPMKSSLTWSLV